MWKNKCDSKNCKSPSWGKSSAGNLLCFRHLMTDVKESGFAERLTRLIDECGSVDDIARVMRIDHKKITLALDGKLTDIQKVLVAAKINIGKEMRNWLFAGGDFPGLVKAEPPAPPEPPSPPEPATLPLPTNEADIIKALFTLSCRVETITLEENKDIILNEGDAPHHRIAEITFRYTNGEAPQFIALNMNVAEPYSFDDLVFLGAVIAEIKRIQEAP